MVKPCRDVLYRSIPFRFRYEAQLDMEKQITEENLKPLNNELSELDEKVSCLRFNDSMCIVWTFFIKIYSYVDQRRNVKNFCDESQHCKK